MKKQSSLLLILMLLLVLAGCGAKPAPTEPPELTVTNAQGASITARSGSYDWDYEAGGGQRTSAIACGMHPLDETLRDSTPALEMPIAVSASFYYTVTLDFGDCAPDSVTLRYWNEQCWGDTQATAEKLTVQRQDDGTYTAELVPSVGIDVYKRQLNGNIPVNGEVNRGIMLDIRNILAVNLCLDSGRTSDAVSDIGSSDGDLDRLALRAGNGISDISTSRRFVQSDRTGHSNLAGNGCLAIFVGGYFAIVAHRHDGIVTAAPAIGLRGHFHFCAVVRQRLIGNGRH